MLWVALLGCTWPEAASPDEARAAAQVARALAVWGLQFTPRVALLERAVLLELEHSLRLFGGLAALRRRVRAQAAELGARAQAWAATGQGALALARAGRTSGPPRELASSLDALPLQCLDAVAEHAQLLQRLGCRSLGDVRRLPRAGLAGRCGARLLLQLDQAYGDAVEHPAWFALPERFVARLELPARVDDAAALLFGARRLLLQLEGWLGARQAGATALSLRWRGDSPAARPDGGQLELRSALPLRSAEQLARLLGEHLAHVRLVAPALELELELLHMQQLVPGSASLLAGALPAQAGDDAQARREWMLALQRVAARLGAQQVLQGSVLAEHRPEGAQAWRAFGEPAAGGAPVPPGVMGARPAFLLDPPQPLACRDGRPLWHGELQLLLGPQRIEAGWWQSDGAGGTHHVARDYWVAAHAHGGLLWVFRSRARGQRPAWFLHGVFA